MVGQLDRMLLQSKGHKFDSLGGQIEPIFKLGSFGLIQCATWHHWIGPHVTLVLANQSQSAFHSTVHSVLQPAKCFIFHLPHVTYATATYHLRKVPCHPLIVDLFFHVWENDQSVIYLAYDVYLSK
jgi:hypothetical protein